MDLPNNMPKIYLSIVVSSYKETKNIKAGALDEMRDYLMKQKYSWEVVLIDDGSPDETGKVLVDYAKKNPHFKAYLEPHRGKAGGVIAGILKAQGEIILFTDMDQATPLNQIEKFFPKFEEGKDVVIGSRVGREGYPIIRLIMAYGFATLRKLILGLPFKDTQCGFKAFKHEAAKNIFERLQVFREVKQIKGAAVTAGFDLEILYIARKLGLSISEVQVEWHEKGLRKEVNPIKDSWDGFRDLIALRINAMMGKYTI